MKHVDAPVQEIAQRLKGLREAVGLTPAKFATKTGITLEKVLAYESGSVELPVSFLFKAAQACGVDLTALLTGGDAHLHSFSLVRKGEGLAAERRKAYKYQSLAFRFAKPDMEPFLVTVPPAKPGDIEDNEHPGQEFIYHLRGRLEVRIAGQPIILEPGDSLYINSMTPHAMRGLDGKEAEFLDVII